jgi:N-acetyl-anhydromuramyl-L-alanine amidase AmpD
MQIQQKNLSWVDESQKIKPTAIVLHWWQVPSWFGGINYLIKGLKRWRTSVQFAITKDGKTYQLVSDPTILCHHARGANRSSLGIEIQGLNAKSLDRNIRQFEAVVELVKYLQDKYKIQTDFKVQEKPELRFYGVTSHK